MRKIWALVAQFGRDANRLVVDWLERQADDIFRARHRPEKVGPPEKLACLHCMESWPCAEMRQWVKDRDSRRVRA